MSRPTTLAELVMADDPTVVLWGSIRRPQLGSAEDRRRERQYDREMRAFAQMGRNMVANARRFVAALDTSDTTP